MRASRRSRPAGRLAIALYHRSPHRRRNLPCGRHPRPSRIDFPHSMSAALHPMLNTAVKAARRAGSIINRASLDLDRVKVSRKTHNDFVTEIDEAAEKAVIDVLLTAYPDHKILAEESGRSGSKKGAGKASVVPDEAA